MDGNGAGGEAVGQTARWTAAARAVETQRADRLFTGAYAERLAGPKGFALLQRFEELTGGRNQVLPMRTRFYDEVIRTTVHEGEVRQVVLLTAGLDTRAFRLSWPAGTTVFEIDQPDLLSAKNVALAEVDAQAACQRQVVEADLREEWASALDRTGYTDRQPCLWVAEGLLCYLPGPAVEQLLATWADRCSECWPPNAA